MNTFAENAPIAGLSWLKSWEMPFEGAYSLMAKCAWANSMGADHLCALVFKRKLLTSENIGSHGRSMLDMAWVGTRDSSGIPYLRDKAIEGALVNWAGKWTPYLASDNTLRYCPKCLAHGYQSAFHQIEGIVSCPIHHQPLETSCRHCGANGQRYALTKVGFANPFHCPTCMAPLASTFDPDLWSDAQFQQVAYAKLVPIARWLQQLSGSTLKWHSWSEWNFPLRWHSTEQERRAATLEVLKRALSPPAGVESMCRRTIAPQVYLGAFAKAAVGATYQNQTIVGDPAAGERLNLYKAIRRYVRRRLGSGCARLPTVHLPRMITTSHSDGAMLLEATECPRPQVYGLWRYHFEDTQRNSHLLVLRPSSFPGPTGTTDIDASAWCSYLLASFYAAIAAVEAWREQAKLLPDASLFGQDRASARELHAKFAPVFSPSILPNLPAVTALTFMDEHQRSRILVVGPADISLSAKNKMEQRLRCRCKGRWGTSHSTNSHTPKESMLASCTVAQEERASPQINLTYFVPMDQLRLPASLDGSVIGAQLRAAGGQSCWAENDLQAISLWLERCTNTATRRVYKRHIEKALIWCVAQRGIALSDMTRYDVDAFTEFLVDPSPRDVWLPSRTDETSGRWSPFEKAPSPQTQSYTLQLLTSLFDEWISQSYNIYRNPCRDSRMVQQAVQRRVDNISGPTRRDAQVTIKEWGYLVQAAGSPMENTSVCLVLYAAYFCALKPSEIGAIQLQDVHRTPSDKPCIDVWSFVIAGRNAQRRQVFLMASLTALLGLIFPASITDFDAYVKNRPDAYLVDLLSPSPRRWSKNIKDSITSTKLVNWMKPLFKKAALCASRAGDTVAAQRLDTASLPWVTNALEKHLEGSGKASSDLWVAIGSCKLCPASLIDYLPDRETEGVEEISRALNGLQTAVENITLQNPT